MHNTPTGNTHTIASGMTFNVAVGLHNLDNTETTNEKLKKYSMLLADTVLVRPTGPEVLTTQCQKEWQDIAYNLNAESDGEIDEEEELKNEAQDLLIDNVENGVRGVRRTDNLVNHSEEAKRRDKQQKLLEKLNKETLERITAQKGQQDDTRGAAAGRNISEIMAYKGVRDMPRITEHVI